MALTFEYKVRDKAGSLVEGQVEGDSMALVVRRLRDMGYMPISVTPKSAVNLKTEIKIPGLSDRVKLREVAVITRQLSTMVDSGLSVVRSIGILVSQVENPTLKRVLGEVRLDLEHGSSLSAACAKHPKIFSHLFCTLVQAGEVGGNLDEVLKSLADTIEKQAQLNRTIRSAMTYPAVVLGVMVIIFTAMIVFIVPVFQNLFTSLGGKLPFPTRVLIKISQIMTSVWVLLVIAVIVGAIVGLRKWIATEEGRRKWDRLILKPPVFGALIHKVALARVTNTLASLISSGVPILESLDICSDVAGNRTVGDVLTRGQGGRQGRPALGGPLTRTRGSHPSAGRADGRGGRTDRCARCHAQEGRPVLRPGGRGHRQQPDFAARAAIDRVHGSGRRRDGHLPVPADVRLHQAHS